jgi:hypothetical protein
MLNLFKYNAVKTCDSTLEGDESKLHAPAALPPWGKYCDIHWIRGWVDPRAGLDSVQKGIAQ